MTDLETLDRLIKERERLETYIELLESGTPDDIQKCLKLLKNAVKGINEAIQAK